MKLDTGYFVNLFASLVGNTLQVSYTEYHVKFYMVFLKGKLFTKVGKNVNLCKNLNSPHLLIFFSRISLYKEYPMQKIL